MSYRQITDSFIALSCFAVGFCHTGLYAAAFGGYSRSLRTYRMLVEVIERNAESDLSLADFFSKEKETANFQRFSSISSSDADSVYSHYSPQKNCDRPEIARHESRSN